jgi:hypothetical protein
LSQRASDEIELERRLQGDVRAGRELTLFAQPECSKGRIHSACEFVRSKSLPAVVIFVLRWCGYAAEMMLMPGREWPRARLGLA